MIHEGEILRGTYKVEKQIGHGGTGLVFLAYHLNLRKRVVIKRVNAGFANLNSLRAETDILKNLHNSRIPQVYDFIVRDGEVFTVMDYIEGTSCDRLPAGSRRMTEPFLVNLLLQMGQTLSYLHRHKPQVIHSDIKPDNLILKPDGEICLIDFNISVSASAPASLSGFTVHFASPEQCRRSMDLRMGRRNIQPLDARTDIYSTGALFYYLATGLFPDTRRPPGASSGPRGGAGAAAPNNEGLLYRDMAEHGYSDAFCRVICRCLSWDRRQRYADGSRLYSAVRHLKRQDRRFQKYLLLRAGSWIITALLIGSGSWFLLRGARQSLMDSYSSDLSAFTRDLSLMRIQEASEEGARILNNSRYHGILEQKPEDEAVILQAMGDAAYTVGQYGEAHARYEEALKAAEKRPSRNQSSMSRFYRDYAIALAMDSQVRRARIVLDEAKLKGISDPDSELVEAYICLQSEEWEECIERVKALLEMGADGEMKARSCTVAADACRKQNEDEEELEWLLLATEYSGDAKYQRMLGAAWWARAADTRRTPEQKEYSAKEALKCYENLSNRDRPLMDDIVSRVVAMQYLGMYEESLRILSPLLETSPEDYRVPMYMAFASDALGDRYYASRYAEMALGIYDSLPYEKKPGTEGDELKYLREIR